MKLYNFSRLIDKYLVPCQLQTKQPGHYDPDTGKWIEPEDKTEDIDLVIIPVDERTRYESGGRYTGKDRMILSTTPLPLQSNVIYGGQTYQIEDYTDYEIYADFNAYIGKWVSLGGNKLRSDTDSHSEPIKPTFRDACDLGKPNRKNTTLPLCDIQTD